MSEQQYRVIADRDKGDDVSAAQAERPEDRLIYERDGDGVALLVRIERPVPTTDYGEHEYEGNTFIHTEPGRPTTEQANERPVPTREQIAEVKQRELAEFMADASTHERAVAAAWFTAGANAVLALLDGADR